MNIISPRFGALDIDDSTTICFPQGLPGFEHCHQFKLLHEDVPEPKVWWLQSLDDPDVIFSLIEAGMLGVNYQIVLSDAEAELLQVNDPNDIALLLTLSRQDGGGEIRANTQSPILLNVASRLALQKAGLRAEIVFTNE
ncbi:flagellar assembly protein FliW [Chitinimonas lacunae]|uniref:Flagellar assembly factor FliW n=1 Tax=Chitinimonas lacunae TaxID=1963018 RepID=A0ABV8MPT2_9NEIS